MQTYYAIWDLTNKRIGLVWVGEGLATSEFLPEYVEVVEETEEDEPTRDITVTNTLTGENTEEYHTDRTIWMVCFFVVTVVLASIIGYYCCQKKKSKQSGDEEDPRSMKP